MKKLLPKGLEQILQAVDFDLVKHSQKIAQVSPGKSFLGKPYHIWLWQVDERAAFILAKWHPCLHQFQEHPGIGHACLVVIHGARFASRGDFVKGLHAEKPYLAAGIPTAPVSG
jgi:hypothetical protein